MITFVLRPRDAKWVADAMLAATVRFDTPTLVGSRFRLTHADVPSPVRVTHADEPGDWLEAVATDRYRVHRIRIRTLGRVRPGEPGEGVLHQETLRWIIRNATYYKDASARVWFEIGEQSVTVTLRKGTAHIHDMLELTSPLVKVGNYPPVEKLFDTAAEAEVDTTGTTRLRMEYLGITAKLGRTRHAEAVVRQTKSASNPEAPGPIVIDYGGWNGESAQALVQPLRTPLEWEKS